MNGVRMMNERVALSAAAVPDLFRDVPASERFNVTSHLTGAVVHPILSLILAGRVLEHAGPAAATGCIIFGVGMTVAYLTSAAYHAARGADRARLRRWDRGGIFIAVASYHTAGILMGTPVGLSLPLLAVIWALAFRAARRELSAGARRQPASVLPYLVLGWGGMVGWGPAATVLTPAGFVWLAISPVAVSLGAVVYRCTAVPRHHELWHVLVLAGNACVLLSWAHGF